MAWLPVAVTATLLGTLVLTAAYGFLYFLDRERFVGIWALAWAVYAVRFVMRLLVVISVEPLPLVEALAQIAVLSNAFLLLCGTQTFVGKRVSQLWMFGALFSGVWVLVLTLLNASFEALTIVPFLFAAAIYARAGIEFYRQRTLPVYGRQAVGVLFMLWAFHKLNFPWLAQVDWFAPWGYLISATLELMVAVSILMLYLLKTREELHHSQTQYEALVNGSPGSVIVMREGRYVFTNPEGARMHGLNNPQDLVGKPIMDFIAPEYHDLIMSRVRAVDAGQTNPAIEIELVRADGTRLAIESTSVPLMFEGKPATLIIGRDISDRKQAEAELARYRLHLEELVAERTSDLQRAYEELQALGRMKDEFVSNVSHELRTPIANLKVYHHLLKRRPEAQAQYLETIQRETERLENLIESLLQLSRLDQARVTFRFAELNLNDLARELVIDRHEWAAGKGQTLFLGTLDDVPLVRADGNLLGQALSILVTNACLYTPAGGLVSVFTACHVIDDLDWVGVGVADTGPGILDDERGHLFDRFYRGAAARESMIPGTGLGLSIAQEIVTRHAGHIEVKNTGLNGEGATFTIWLPAIRPAESGPE